MNKPDYKKITQALNYIAEREGGKINYMKALKLSYLADRLHLRKYGRLITNDRLVAMKNGTLGSQAKDIVSKNKALPYEAYHYSENKLKRDLDKFTIESNYKNKDRLSETDIECIDRVISVVGDKKEFDLAKLTHKLPEWERHEYTINRGENLVVDLEISDLFEPTNDPLLKEIYSQSKEELRLSREIFNESLEQEKCFV